MYFYDADFSEGQHSFDNHDDSKFFALILFRFFVCFFAFGSQPVVTLGSVLRIYSCWAQGNIWDAGNQTWQTHPAVLSPAPALISFPVWLLCPVQCVRDLWVVSDHVVAGMELGSLRGKLAFSPLSLCTGTCSPLSFVMKSICYLMKCP